MNPDSSTVAADAAPTAQARPTAEQVAAAIDTVARAILYDGAQNVEWGDYPEIGEHDWDRVCDRLDVLTPHPDGFHEAYELLERRAEHQS